MVVFDTSTPVLRAAKELCDAYMTLDMNNIQPLLSKNYQYEVAPQCTDFPNLTKEGHLQLWGGVLAAVNKLEVRIRHWRAAFKLRLISATPRPFIMK